MMNAEGAIVPVAEVLEKGGAAFDKSQYLPGIVAYYSRPDGTMLSFPYNSSSPSSTSTRTFTQGRGSTRNDLPKTWPEVWEDAARSSKRRGACGYTQPGSPGSTWKTSLRGTTSNTRPTRMGCKARKSS
jgi:sn-glycerol 3-phosphate transport system substrate-binding protein